MVAVRQKKAEPYSVEVVEQREPEPDHERKKIEEILERLKREEQG